MVDQQSDMHSGFKYVDMIFVVVFFLIINVKSWLL